MPSFFKKESQLPRAQVISILHIIKMSAFNADCDDLNEFFYVSFVEMWEYLSSDEPEEGIESIKDMCACLGKTDKMIDWIMEQLELNYSSDKYFRKAVLNTIDVDRLMMCLNDWRERTVCDKCHLCMVDCVCEDDDKDESEGEDPIAGE